MRTLQERRRDTKLELIAQYLNEGKTIDEIAKELNKSKAVISYYISTYLTKQYSVKAS